MSENQRPDELRVGGVAQRLNCSPTKVRTLIDEGRFPNARKLDPLKKTSPYLIPVSDVVQFEKDRYSPFQGGDSLVAQDGNLEVAQTGN